MDEANIIVTEDFEKKGMVVRCLGVKIKKLFQSATP